MSEISYIAEVANGRSGAALRLSTCACGHHFLAGGFGCPQCGREPETNREVLASGPFPVVRSVTVTAPLAPWPPAPFVVAQIELASDLTALAVIADAIDAVPPGTRLAIDDLSHDYPLFAVVAENPA